MSEGGGDADVPGHAQDADHQVAQGGHDVRPGSGAGGGGVLAEGDVTDPVKRLRRRWVCSVVWAAAGPGWSRRLAGRVGPADAGDGQDLLLDRLPRAGVLIERPDG